MSVNLAGLRQLLTDAAPRRAWVVGDVMLDRYLHGSVSRISPEAPVAVLRLESEAERVGGAANVAANLVALGARVALAGAVGDDEEGARLVTLAASVGVETQAIATTRGLQTTVKTRALAGPQQLLRIDRESPHAAPFDLDGAIAPLRAAVPSPDFIVVSDYAKGVVGEGTIAALRRAAPNVPILVDPKGSDYRRYVGATVITPNEREAELAAGYGIRDDASMSEAAARLRALLSGTDIVLTRGARGMTLFSAQDGRRIDAPAQARRVFDVTGAGDTAIAALAMARAWDLAWEDALHVANVAAGIKVAQIGAVLVSQAEVLAALSHERFALKRIARHDLARIRAQCSARGQRLVFTNGCFDLLHPGHVRLLERARAFGDVLVVGINDDDSVRRLKGANRPILPVEDRATILSALEAVDHVSVFGEDTPLEVIRLVRPDVLVKGGDYSPATIVGADDVTGWGGRVEIVPLVPSQSTTSIEQRITSQSSDRKEGR